MAGAKFFCGVQHDNPAFLSMPALGSAFSPQKNRTEALIKSEVLFSQSVFLFNLSVPFFNVRVFTELPMQSQMNRTRLRASLTDKILNLCR